MSACFDGMLAKINVSADERISATILPTHKLALIFLQENDAKLERLMNLNVITKLD